MSINARFNTYNAGGDVTLTLTPARPVLRHYAGGATDEGYDLTVETWELGRLDDGRDAVFRSWHRDACDCDGRLAEGGELVCPVDRLRAREVDGVLYPDWDAVDQYQRDYQAEAAGY